MLSRTAVLLVAVVACLSATGCGGKRIEGKYSCKVTEGNMTFVFSLELKSGGRASLSRDGEAKELRYAIDGDKITIGDSKTSDRLALTLGADGSLSGDGMTFTKEGGGANTVERVAAGGAAGAKAFALGERDAHFAKCDGLWTTAFGSGQFAQFKSLDVTITEDKVSEADRLNGIEWRGQWRYAKTPVRRYVPKAESSLSLLREFTPGWNAWKEEDVSQRAVWKVKGEWHVDEPPRFSEDNFSGRKPGCAEVPK